MNRAGLGSHLRQLPGIGDRLSACIHVAPTARSEPDSRLIERLKDPQRANPQRHKQREAPAARRIEGEECCREENRDRKRHEPKCQALSLTARTDVGDLHYFNV